MISSNIVHIPPLIIKLIIYPFLQPPTTISLLLYNVSQPTKLNQFVIETPSTIVLTNNESDCTDIDEDNITNP